jgi:TonB family protein
MTPHHADILDQHEPVKRPFLFALGLHGGLLAAAIGYNLIGTHRDTFGAKDAGGGAVGVQVVATIPLPHSGPTNPVANDTQSQVPQAPVTKPEPRTKKEVIPPDAVRLKDRTKKRLTDIASSTQRFRSFKEVDQNQAFSSQAPQVSSPIFAAAPGSGRIGAGPATMIGTKFPQYAAQIQQIITQKWKTGDVDPQIRVGPQVIVTFEIRRDGRAANFKFLQQSGISSLDYSIRRAIEDASPFPPLPPGFNEDTAPFEYWFEFKR